MIPPPTPVPQKTPSSDANSRAAPSSNSASVATLTSLPIATGAPSACCSAPASGKLPSQSGRLRALETTPAASSITPGEPTPIATGSPWPLRGLAHRLGHRVGDVLRAALRGRRDAGVAEHLEALVDDDGLDLGAAEVDPAAQAHARTITPSHVSHSAGSSPPWWPRKRCSTLGGRAQPRHPARRGQHADVRQPGAQPRADVPEQTARLQLGHQHDLRAARQPLPQLARQLRREPGRGVQEHVARRARRRRARGSGRSPAGSPPGSRRATGRRRPGRGRR